MIQFQIGRFHIDIKRCRISAGDYEVVVEPKVMDVLKYLYSQHGEVISQQQIFESVWPNSTFNPSSVQRCIALLRKALQEDARNPQYLITHPKRGYSLILPVANARGSQSNLLAYLLIIASLLLAFIGYFVPTDQSNTDFSRLLPITSSETNEAFLSLSPDGQHLAFTRGDGSSKNIWIKETKTGKEVKLTHNDSLYFSLGWSPDGTSLAFVEDVNDLNVISYISLDKLTMSPLKKIKVYQFSDFRVSSKKLQWTSHHHLYFIEQQRDNNDTWLSSINLIDKSKTQLVKATGQDWLLSLSVSPSQQKIALGYEEGQNRYRIDVFELASSQQKTLARIEDSIQGLSWHPDDKSVLVSNRTVLQLIADSGSISHIDFDNFQFIRNAQYSASGDEIFMELLNVDVDIFRKTESKPQEAETLVNTSSLDFKPVFSPDDQRFVFESHRTGLKQLYLYEDGEQKLIFSNPNNEELFGTLWSPNGQHVITASKNKLFKIDPQSATYEEIPHPHHSFYLREHFSHQAALLVSYRAADGATFHPAKLNLDTMDLTTYTRSGQRLVCYSMALDAQDNIYFASNREVFRLNENAYQESLWQSEGANISELSVQGNAISFMLDEDEQFQITRVNLQNGETEIIHQGIEDGTMYSASSRDHKQFLYLSKPKRRSHLVKLLR